MAAWSGQSFLYDELSLNSFSPLEESCKVDSNTQVEEFRIRQCFYLTGMRMGYRDNSIGDLTWFMRIRKTTLDAMGHVCPREVSCNTPPISLCSRSLSVANASALCAYEATQMISLPDPYERSEGSAKIKRLSTERSYAICDAPVFDRQGT